MKSNAVINAAKYKNRNKNRKQQHKKKNKAKIEFLIKRCKMRKLEIYTKGLYLLIEVE